MHKELIAFALLLAFASSALTADSFPAYRAYEETAPADWRALNERMRALGGHRGHVSDVASAPTADAPHMHGSTASPNPAAPAAASPSTGGHQSMHGRMHPQQEKP